MATWKDGGRMLAIETHNQTTRVRVFPDANVPTSAEIYIPLSTLKEMVNAQ